MRVRVCGFVVGGGVLSEGLWRLMAGGGKMV